MPRPSGHTAPVQSAAAGTSHAVSPLRLRLLRLRLHLRLKRRRRSRSAVLALLLTACGAGTDAAREAAPLPPGHRFEHQAAGISLDLPANWAGRYRVQDTITRPAAGVERELTLRLVRGDSSVAPDPLLVIHVVSTSAWNATPADSAGAWWGTRVAQDASRTLAIKPAAGNALAAGTADALAFDSLMFAVLQRPLRAALRAASR